MYIDDLSFCSDIYVVSQGIILPKQTLKVTFQVEIDDYMAAELNAGSPALQTTLIIHAEHGLDYFVAISGSFGE